MQAVVFILESENNPEVRGKPVIIASTRDAPDIRYANPAYYNIWYPSGYRIRQAGYKIIEKAGHPAKYAAKVFNKHRPDLCFLLSYANVQLFFAEI